MNEQMTMDRIRGSLVGGAVGDALGYTVEFMSYSEIVSHFGEGGIHRYPGGMGLISDDTQMTLFTAYGLLNALGDKDAFLPSIRQAYIEWFFTQGPYADGRTRTCWVGRIPEMVSRRAPGITCMRACASLMDDKDVSNDSKGCGGIMRIAPVALYGAAQGRIKDVSRLDRLAGDAAQLTHLHPLGYMPAALASHIIYRMATKNRPDREALAAAAEEGLEYVRNLYPSEWPVCGGKLEGKVKDAVYLAGTDIPDEKAIRAHLGEGWVAEETLAVALYCALAHFDDFGRAIRAAVNHSGDSDSTGAVTGNILGAACGYEAIPIDYRNGLELHRVILHVADDLFIGNTTPYET